MAIQKVVKAVPVRNSIWLSYFVSYAQKYYRYINNTFRTLIVITAILSGANLAMPPPYFLLVKVEWMNIIQLFLACYQTPGRRCRFIYACYLISVSAKKTKMFIYNNILILWQHSDRIVCMRVSVPRRQFIVYHRTKHSSGYSL